ncbi:MAG TPA: hypothetical protein VGD17_13555 [Chitinophagaceae bacterium]
MKLLLKVFFGCLLAVAGIIVLSARKTAKKEQVQTHTYYYYPKVNMYYDVSKGTYIFLAEDGKTWQSAKQVSDKLNTGMGKKAVLNNPPLPVWKSNEYHRMVYSTSLYASAKDFRKDQPKPQPKVTKPAVARKVEEKKEEKKDSGIERFFKRLFKKKEDTAQRDKKQQT